MEVIIQPDSEQASQLAARLVKKIIMERTGRFLVCPPVTPLYSFTVTWLKCTGKKA